MYKITWKDKNEKTCILTIQNGSATVVNLTPSANPFVTQIDDDDDFFAPLRTQSGTIGIIAEVGDIDAIIGDNPLERKVTLLVDNRLTWVGYLQSAVYTQPFSAGKAEISIPVVSPFALLESLYPTWTNMAYISFADLLTEMNTALNDVYSDVAFPSRINAATTLQYMISEYTYASIDSNDPSKYEYSSYKDILIDILNLFGLQLIENGTELIFFQRDVELSYTLFEFDDLTTPTGTISITNKANLLNNVSGAEHTIDYLKGKKSMEVTGQFKKYSDVLGDFNVPGSYCKYDASVSTQTFETLGQSIFYKSLVFTNTFINAQILKSSSSLVNVKNLKLSNAAANTAADKKSYYGACIAKEQVIKEDGTGEWRSGVIIHNITESMITACTIEMPKRFLYDVNTKDSFITISSKIMSCNRGRDQFENNDGYILMTIKCGNQYFKQDTAYSTKGTWQTSEISNSFKIKEGALTTDSNDDFPNSEELRIHVTPITNGSNITTNSDIEISFVLPKYSEDSKYYLISELKVSTKSGIYSMNIPLYNETIEYEDDENKNSNSIKYIIGNGFLDEYSVKSGLTISQQLESGDGIVYNSPPLSRPTTLYGSKTPEKDYADRIKAYYSSSRTKLTAQLKKDSINMYNSTVISGKAYIPIAKQTNWRDAIETVTLLELPQY